MGLTYCIALLCMTLIHPITIGTRKKRKRPSSPAEYGLTRTLSESGKLSQRRVIQSESLYTGASEQVESVSMTSRPQAAKSSAPTIQLPHSHSERQHNI